MKKIFKWIGGLIGLLFLIVFSIPMVVYVHGAGEVSYLYEPPSHLQSEDVLISYKIWLGRQNNSEYKKLNPYSYLFHLAKYIRGQTKKYNIRSDMRLYNNAARTRYFSVELRPHYRSLIDVIYVSRHWTVDQMISEVLNKQYYGNKIYGFEHASVFYFGVPSSELTTGQLFALFHIPEAPSRFDLWCDMKYFKDSLESRLLSREVAYSLPSLNLRKRTDKKC